MSLNELKEQANQIRKQLNKNSRKNNRLWHKTGEFDFELLKDNERLTEQLQELSSQIMKMEKWRVVIK